MAKEWGLEQLVDMTVTAIIETPKDGEDGRFFGLHLEDKKTKKVVDAWIQCDPEGNGPGFLQIDKED